MKRIIPGLVSLALLLLIISCGSKEKGLELDQLNDVELLELANSQYNSGDAASALKTCELLLMKYPTSNYHIETQLLMAKAHGSLDQYEEQMNLLLRLLRENIIPGYSPQIFVQIGKFYERAALFNPGLVTSDTSDYRLALNYYDKALNYPDSDDEISKSEAQFRRGLVEAKIGEIDAAIEEYKKVIKNFPQSDFSLLAQMKLTNPNDISELKTDNVSLSEYRATLELPALPETSPSQRKTGAEAKERAEDESGSMESLIEETLEDTDTPTEADEPGEPVEDESSNEEEEMDPFAIPEQATDVPETESEALPDTSSAPE
jgi:tetratricopeptide (TPR) repeat protein